MITIAMTTIKEILKKRIFYLMLVFTLLYLSLYCTVIVLFKDDISFNSNNSGFEIPVIASRIISIFGFYFSSILVMLFSILICAGTVVSEIESGIAQTIITRLPGRVNYLAGKYLGFALILCSYSILLFILLLLLTSVLGIPVISNINPGSLVKGLTFTMLQPLTVISLAVFLGCRYRSLQTGIILAVIYVLGFAGGVTEQIGMLAGNRSITSLGIAVSLISPFDVLYRQSAGSIFGSNGLNTFFPGVSGVNSNPGIFMNIYIVLYNIFLFVVALIIFRKKDIN